MTDMLKNVARHALPLGIFAALAGFFSVNYVGGQILEAAGKPVMERAASLAISVVSLINPAAHAKWVDDEPPNYKSQWEAIDQLQVHESGTDGGGGLSIMTLRPMLDGRGYEAVFASADKRFRRVSPVPQVVVAAARSGHLEVSPPSVGGVDAAEPIIDLTRQLTGIVLVRLPQGSYASLQAQIDEWRLEAAVFGFVLFSLLGVLLRPRTARDLGQLESELEAVAESGQLSSRLKFHPGSPFVSVARKFNAILDRFHQTLSSVRKGADLVSASSQRVSLTATEVSRMANEVATTIQQVAKGTEDQSSRTSELHSIIHQVSESAQSNRRKAEETAIASEGASEIAQTIHHLAQDAVSKMETLSKDIRSTAEVIYALGEQSEKIGEVVDIIRSVADQTNLLALNAAIEAARAGDAGRGFAVVADEVRKLAEGSATSADQIAAMISQIQGSTKDAVGAMQKGSEGVSEGSEVISRVGSGLNQIMDAIRRTSQLAMDISKNAREQTSRTSAGAQRIEEINAIAEETAASTEEVAASTQQATASMQELTATSAQLAEMSRELQGLVAKFDSRN